MKIGILGTRGIPNNYGGFEQLAEYLSVELAKRGHKVSVYCSSLHSYQEKEFNGVELIHCKDPENKIGTAGQFVYDLNCIRDSRQRNFDVLLQLGYTSSSVWNFLLPKETAIVTNMDGLEWKRSKYSAVVKRFLHVAEKLAVKSSDILIADSPAITDYLREKYKDEAVYIAYGAELFQNPDENRLKEMMLHPYSYGLLIARFEPENNIEMVVEGFLQQSEIQKLVLIGNHQNKFGTYMKGKYATNSRIVFQAAVYDIALLNNLRHFSQVYFHGHSVGGTNPSLLEAMASSALICAHDNPFNKAVLQNGAFYFTNATQVSEAIEAALSTNKRNEILEMNKLRITAEFSWKSVIDKYEKLFLSTLQQ
jgi:glycosyltransferase involved in cell wall biosynthesis